jgi:hypothetical protein
VKGRTELSKISSARGVQKLKRQSGSAHHKNSHCPTEGRTELKKKLVAQGARTQKKGCTATKKQKKGQAGKMR